MIGYLKGQVSHISSENCLLNIGGVGYEISCPNRTLQQLKADEKVELFIYTHVREDQLKLFGFKTETDKELFISILDVSGVGPKIALSILTAGTASQIKQAIAQADVNFFTQIKGLGKKNAQKIIIELKTKLGSVKELDLAQSEAEYSPDVIAALQSFGFLKRDILKTLKTLDSNLSEQELIKQSLTQLGKTN